MPRLEEKIVVTSKWLYNIKHAIHINIEKFKARFMVKVFSLKEEVDHEEKFSLVSKYTSIRESMSLVSFMGCKIHYMDVKTTFLNVINEE